MRILFTTFGSLGDLHPYIAIALEAKKRGHEPVFATAAKYRAKVEALGLEFRTVRPDLPPEDEFAPMAKKVMDLKDGPRYLFQDILSPVLRESYADLLEASDGMDLLISHPAVLTCPLVAQKTGKKWMSSCLAPISLWSKSDPPVPPTVPQFDFLRALGPIWPTIMFGLGRAGTKAWVDEVDRLREEVGVPSLGHPMFEGQFSPYGTLALFSRHFAPVQKDWPSNTTATGFCFYDAKGYEKQVAAPEPVRELSYQEWVDNGEAPADWPVRSKADGSTHYEHPQPLKQSEDWKEWMNADEPPFVFALGSSAVFD
ncbi:glycosyltransferase, partial [bacterium]